MLLIKNGYMIAPQSGREWKFDILTKGEKILQIENPPIRLSPAGSLGGGW